MHCLNLFFLISNLFLFPIFFRPYCSLNLFCYSFTETWCEKGENEEFNTSKNWNLYFSSFYHSFHDSIGELQSQIFRQWNKVLEALINNYRCLTIFNWLGVMVVFIAFMNYTNTLKSCTLSCIEHDRLPFSVIFWTPRVFSVPHLMFHLLPLAFRIL